MDIRNDARTQLNATAANPSLGVMRISGFMLNIYKGIALA